MKIYSTSFLNIIITITMLLFFSCGSRQDKTRAGTDTTNATTTVSKLEGTISVSGAFALYPMMVKWKEEF